MRRTSTAKGPLSAAIVLCLFFVGAAVGRAENLHWNAAGAPSDSFELTDGPVPNPQPGDQVFTATNTCDSSTVRATFGNPDGVADPGEPFVGLRAPDTVDWWIEGTAFDDPSTSANDARLTFTLEFLGDPVEDLQFTLYDVDLDSWEDQYLISGQFVNPVNVNVTSCGSSMSCTGSGTTLVTATGTAAATFGDATGNLVVTIPGPVQVMTMVYQVGPADNSSSNLNGDQLTGISDLTFSCSTVPVTLSSFVANRRGGLTEFRWTTATETSNVGFHLYGEIDGEWRRLNRRLIPSRSLDSLEPRSYSEALPQRGATRFVIADVDTRGREEIHGPFESGVQSGVSARPEPIDWQPIRAGRDLRAEARQGDRGASLLSRAEARLTSASSARARSATSAGALAAEGIGGYELRVAETGLYRVPFDAVPGLAGVPLADVAVTEGGRPLSIRVEGGGGSALFGPGSFVEFYGQALTTLYTRTNVYTLEANAAKARRVLEVARRASRPSAPSYQATTRVEKDLVYSFASPNGDPWYETSILAFDQPVSRSFEFDADQIGDGESTLQIDLWGVTDWTDRNPDHHVLIALNGYQVADEWFDGLSEVSLDLPLPAGALFEGTNEIEITSLGDTGARYDLIHIDGYGATYSRLFTAADGRFSGSTTARTIEVTNLDSPDVVAYRARGRGLVRLADVEVTDYGSGSYAVRLPASPNLPHEYLVSTTERLLLPEIAPLPELEPIRKGRADYLLISHPDFIDHLQPLVAARSRDGLRVKVVDVEQIYRQHGGGVFSPEAIRDFIGYWTGAKGTRYVLLVGGDSYDYLDHLEIGSISFIPTLYEATHSVVRFAPSDAALADAKGDGMPDAAIGRLPVRTVEELELMIDKTLAYSPAGSAIFAADAQDGAASFSDLSDELAAELPGVTVDRAYLDDLGVDGARQKLLTALDSGVGLAHYFGHSGPAGWTFSGLLGSADPEALQNHGRPTVVLQWGCWGGYHSVPQFDTMSHRFLLSGPQGAAAVLGASGLTEIAADRDMARLVYQQLAVPGTRLGDALLAAKQELGPAYRDVVLGMTLLGDPALIVN